MKLWHQCTLFLFVNDCLLLLGREREREKGLSGEVGDEGADTVKESGLYTAKSWERQQHGSGHQ